MRKTLGTLIATTALIVGPATIAGADPTIPDVPPCATELANPATHAASWTAFEADCGVTFAGVERQYVNLLEYMIDRSGQQIAADRVTIAAQSTKITHQAKVIKRLRHRLATR